MITNLMKLHNEYIILANACELFRYLSDIRTEFNQDPKPRLQSVGK